MVLGIDPGKSGGYALWEAGELVEVAGFDKHSDADIVQAFRDIHQRSLVDGVKLVAYLEQVGGYIKGNPMPGSAMFKFGESFGLLVGTLIALGISFRRVRPQEWQKGLQGVTGLKGVDRKRKLRDLATEIYPLSNPTLKTADAILIADYGAKLETK